jgi:hypothetical protein
MLFQACELTNLWADLPTAMRDAAFKKPKAEKWARKICIDDHPLKLETK